MGTLMLSSDWVSSIPTMSSITFLQFFNIECALLILQNTWNSGKQGFQKQSNVDHCYDCLRPIAMVVYFAVMCAVSLTFWVGLSLTVISLKLAQVDFVQIAFIGPDTIFDEDNDRNIHNWSWPQFFTFIVVLYQIINIVPVDDLQKRRLIMFQKELFGKKYWDERGNLREWIALVMRSRGCGYWYTVFYLAAIDYKGVEDVLKLTIENNELVKEYHIIDLCGRRSE